MKRTFNEYWNDTYAVYDIILDNKGNFKYGDGIIPYKVAKDTELIMKETYKKEKE